MMQSRPKGESRQENAHSRERIRNVEEGLPPLSLGPGEPSVELTVGKLMEIFGVPGLSLAVIQDFQIAWAKGYGVSEAGRTSPVTTRTLFQAGSVSKPVAAAAALALVEQGPLSLDQDVNRRLIGWQVPENDYTRDQKVTLRRLLSHTAGLSVHFFPGHAVDAPLPTLVQVLNGEKPANTAPVRLEHVPGNGWHYSGGGYLVVQQLMIDAVDKPFPQIVRETIFDKAGMEDSSFEQPLPLSSARNAASGTLGSGQVVPGKWHIYPEMAAGGLWTTASDLARFAIEIAQSRAGRSNRILSQTMAAEMLKPQAVDVSELSLGDKTHRDRMGLGFFLGDETRPDLFGHIGDDLGFQAMLLMFGESGQGAAVMANSENGIFVGDYLVESIAKEFGWERFLRPDRPRLVPSIAPVLTARQKGMQAALEQYHELKRMPSTPYAPDRDSLLVLGYELLMWDQLQDALHVLTVETEEYPEYWRAFSTLGAVFRIAGDKMHALENYRRAVELEPEDRNSLEAIKNLSGQ